MRERTTNQTFFSPKSSPKQETSANPASLSPEKRAEILEYLQPDDYSGSLKRIFTDDQIESAKNSEIKFRRILEQALVTNPELIFPVIDQVPDFYNTEQIRAHLNQLLETKPELLINNFSKLKNFYSADEQKTIIRQALALDRHKDISVMFCFSNPDIVAQFEVEELRSIVLESIHNIRAGGVHPEQLHKFVQLGVLTNEDMRTTALSLLAKEEPYLDNEHEFEKYFPEPEKVKFKQAVKNAFIRPNDPLSLYHLESHSAIFSDTEKSEIVRTRLQNSPEATRHIDLLLKYLSPEEAHDSIVATIRRRDPNFFDFAWNSVLDKKILSPAEEKELWQTLATLKPGLALVQLDGYLEHFPDNEKEKVIRDLLESAGPASALGNLDNWLNYLETDPIKQKKMVENLILAENSFAFVAEYVSNQNDERAVLPRLFNASEIKTLLDKQLELGIAQAFDQLKSIRKFLGSDQVLKEWLQTTAEKDPTELIKHIKEIKYLYQPDEIKKIVEAISLDQRGLSACLTYFDEWAPLLGKDYSWEFVKKASLQSPHFVLGSLLAVIPCIPPDQRKKFITDLVKANPPIAYSESETIARHLPEMTPEFILQIAQEDKNMLAFAPKTLPELYKRIARASNIKDTEPLLMEAYELYAGIALIKSRNLEPTFKQLQEHQSIPQKMEGRAIETFQGLAILSQNENGIEPIETKTLKNLTEADRLLFQELAKRMNLPREVTEEEGQRFMQEMETPVPFLTYYLQYEKSPAHKKLLSEIFEAILAGTYSEWKYGPATEEGLQQMKDRGLLPRNLTLEQYLAWRKDDSSELFESLAADAQTVAKEIKHTALDNLQHLDNSILETGIENPKTTLNELAQGLVKLGQESGLVNKELGALKKTDLASDSLGSARRDALVIRKRELDEQKRIMTVGRSLLRLVSLLPQEISAGYFLEGEDRKKKGDKISAVIDSLKREIPEEGRFVLSNMFKLLEEFHNQNQASQNLKCIDSSRPKHLFEVGAKPIASCQHYGHGSHNDCLLGYSGPDTKILILENEQGNIVARSIFRILSLDDKDPGEHVERIYSSTASLGVAKAIYTHAITKSEKSSVAVYTSRNSQDEQGQETETPTIKSLSFVNSSARLHSYNNRAPKVYVDSAGGARSFGKYAMEDLLEIKK